MPRVCGLETEFGCAVYDPALGRVEDLVEQIKNTIIIDDRRGLIDLHARGSYNPAGCGGFLTNGGRLYIELVGSHLEYATAECRKIRDLLAQIRAGQTLLQSTLDRLDMSESVKIYNNSIDHYSGTTFGCHENYSVGGRGLDALLDAEFFGVRMLHLLLPFIVTRQIWAGAGRVGGHRIVERAATDNVLQPSGFEADTRGVGMRYGVTLDPVPFQLSQRADHIVRPSGSRVRFNRSLINLQRNRNRLHMLGGEANMSEYTNALKLGITGIVLDLLELDLVPPTIRLYNAVGALRSISRDQRWKWVVDLEDGRTIRAVDIQRIYLKAALDNFKGQDAQTDWLMAEWQQVLDALERDPLLLADRLDWVAKYRLLQVFMREEGLDWDAEVLHSLDLAYHDINPATGLALGLEQAGQLRRITTAADIESALEQPPADTRAAGRGSAVRRLLESGTTEPYKIDWSYLSIGTRRRLQMPEPEQTYLSEALNYVRQATDG